MNDKTNEEKCKLYDRCSTMSDVELKITHDVATNKDVVEATEAVMLDRGIEPPATPDE